MSSERAMSLRAVRHLLLLGGALLAVATGCSNTKPTSVTVPMEFRPTSSLDLNRFSGTFGQTKVYVAPVDDKRDNKDMIGENREEALPVPVHAAPGTKGPAEMVHDVLVDDLRSAGVNIVENGADADRTLSVELTRFFTTETNLYRCEVRVLAQVTGGGNKGLWRGPASGESERFGRSLQAENYQEVFSDSIQKIVEGLLSNPAFQRAIAPAVNAAPAAHEISPPPAGAARTPATDNPLAPPPAPAGPPAPSPELPPAPPSDVPPPPSTGSGPGFGK